MTERMTERMTEITKDRQGKSSIAPLFQSGAITRCRTDVEETMITAGRFDHDHVEEGDRTMERQAARQSCENMRANVT